MPLLEQTDCVWSESLETTFADPRPPTAWEAGIGLSLRAVPLFGWASHLLYGSTGDFIVFSCTCAWLFRVPSFVPPSSITWVTWCVTWSRLGRFFFARFFRCSMQRIRDSPSMVICTDTRSSAVAEKPRDASCRWIFCQVTQGRSKWHPWVRHV